MTKQRMVQLRAQGSTLQQIADAAECSVGMVFNATGGRRGEKRNGYGKRPPRHTKRNAEIRKLVESGYHYSEVANMYKLSKSRIGQIVTEGICT